MSKIISVKMAVDMINDGDVVMVGGFYGVGAPEKIIDEIVFQKKRDLTVITCEGGWPDRSVGKLIANHCARKLITSWTGNLTCLTEMVESGEVELELNPQGTLAERIRAGGSGLGGVLTKTGLGTVIESEDIGVRVNLNGSEWLYHTPLRANIGLVAAWRADAFGNLIFDGTENNYNAGISMASDIVIAEVGGEISPIGSLDKNQINVSGIFIDKIVEGWKNE
jgi:acetate CoA/acetoacetate CoA-transferase alpha subunit